MALNEAEIWVLNLGNGVLVGSYVFARGTTTTVDLRGS